MAFNLYLVRHGQTLLNYYKRMQGWSDSPLTAQGLKDGEIAGKNLAEIKFDRVFRSDTMRTKETCEAILRQNKFTTATPIAMRNFREQNFGYFEGSDDKQAWLMIGAAHGCSSYQEIMTKYSLRESRDFAKQADPFSDAEDDAQFWTRVKIGFDYLRKIAQPEENILVVSHGMTIMSIVHLFAPEIDFINNGAKNGSITKLRVDEHDFKVCYYNQVDPDFDYLQ
ncbi:histidine phosphatase family protein [Ligilactobacillus sp. Marseille-Q7487]|uniref:histidine phosphatase family protein n=1 Tax=Ligilactobacillus sp. Marseille-Q7487 TaxID=3022128 RepID=UPI0024A8C201|nr:histidine phosphatase family protein [Ligilactobacillus sp. Marseille-Q7487]